MVQLEDLVSEQPYNTVVTDISPVQGRLVVFDSVMVPHQVEVVREEKDLPLQGGFMSNLALFRSNSKLKRWASAFVSKCAFIQI